MQAMRADRGHSGTSAAQPAALRAPEVAQLATQLAAQISAPQHSPQVAPQGTAAPIAAPRAAGLVAAAPGAPVLPAAALAVTTTAHLLAAEEVRALTC
jgi:hypothetical protein